MVSHTEIGKVTFPRRGRAAGPGRRGAGSRAGARASRRPRQARPGSWRLRDSAPSPGATGRMLPGSLQGQTSEQRQKPRGREWLRRHASPRSGCGRADSAPRPVRRHARGGREPHMRVRQARMRVLAVSVRPTSSPFAPPPISTFPGEGDHDPRPPCPGLCPTPPASGARTLGPVGGPLGGGVHGVPSRGGEGGGRRPGTNGSQCPWVARTQPGTACGRGRGALPGRAYRSRASCPRTGQEGGRRLALGGASSQESRWRNDRGRKRQLPLKLA